MLARERCPLCSFCDGHRCLYSQTLHAEQEVQAALEAAGCAHIACNAITANNGAKALLRVAEAASFPLSKEQARSRASFDLFLPCCALHALHCSAHLGRLQGLTITSLRLSECTRCGSGKLLRAIPCSI